MAGIGGVVRVGEAGGKLYRLGFVQGRAYQSLQADAIDLEVGRNAGQHASVIVHRAADGGHRGGEVDASQLELRREIRRHGVVGRCARRAGDAECVGVSQCGERRHDTGHIAAIRIDHHPHRRRQRGRNVGRLVQVAAAANFHHDVAREWNAQCVGAGCAGSGTAEHRTVGRALHRDGRIVDRAFYHRTADGRCWDGR